MKTSREVREELLKIWPESIADKTTVPLDDPKWDTTKGYCFMEHWRIDMTEDETVEDFANRAKDLVREKRDELNTLLGE